MSTRRKQTLDAIEASLEEFGLEREDDLGRLPLPEALQLAHEEKEWRDNEWEQPDPCCDDCEAVDVGDPFISDGLDILFYS